MGDTIHKYVYETGMLKHSTQLHLEFQSLEQRSVYLLYTSALANVVQDPFRGGKSTCERQSDWIRKAEDRAATVLIPSLSLVGSLSQLLRHPQVGKVYSYAAITAAGAHQKSHNVQQRKPKNGVYKTPRLVGGSVIVVEWRC